MGKKNLEQLFKDTFENFKETPDEGVWDSIEATLDKKKQKRRVIPIWWRLGGVAALLAVLFYIINPLDTSVENAEEIITDVETLETSPNTETKIDEVDAETITRDFEEQQLTDTSDETQGPLDPSSSLTNVDQQSGSKKGLAPKTEDKGMDLINNEAAIATTVSKKDNGNSLQQDNPSIAENKTQTENTIENQVKRPILEDSSIEDAIAKNAEPKNDSEKKAISDVLNNDSKEKEAVAENMEKEKEVEKKSIFEAIAEQEEEIELADASQGKWSVGPSVAPVYFNGTGEGSPIHSNFASNSKSGNVNLSYGLTVSYNIGKRLKIRSGVHRVNYGYDTNEVLFSSSLDGSTSQTIDNINYSETSRSLVVQSKNEVQTNAFTDASVELTANELGALEGKMVQQLGYIEVPLELNYTLVDKKLGVDIIGGVSSLFLVDNAVLLESQDLVTEMGEANNANSVNYSTNIGVGFNYEISPKLQFNLEPVFKYQLNTFSETAGPFRPYSVGVYSGVSFRF